MTFFLFSDYWPSSSFVMRQQALQMREDLRRLVSGIGRLSPTFMLHPSSQEPSKVLSFLSIIHDFTIKTKHVFVLCSVFASSGFGLFFILDLASWNYVLVSKFKLLLLPFYLFFFRFSPIVSAPPL